MKGKRTTKGKKTKIWIAGLVGALLIGMLGACGGESESEPVDRSMPITEETTEEPKDKQKGEEPELIAEMLPATEEATEMTKEIVSEPTATPAPTPEPTSTPAPTPTPTPTEEPVVEKATPTGTDYILNTNTYKFHYPSCSSVKQMKDKNKAYYTGTREECISMGYDPCGRCEP